MSTEQKASVAQVPAKRPPIEDPAVDKASVEAAPAEKPTGKVVVKPVKELVGEPVEELVEEPAKEQVDEPPMEKSPVEKPPVEQPAAEKDLHNLELQILNTLPLPYSEAINTNRNLVHEVDWLQATVRLYDRLLRRRKMIRALTKHHLGLNDEATCLVSASDAWIRGSFNICIPVEVKSHNVERKLILRCAMPHKLAEAKTPGTVDEKVRCEVGAYAWMQDQCADIRVPELYGFGLHDQRQFTHVSNRPLLTRLMCCLRRFVHSLLGRETLVSRYVPHQSESGLPVAYMLLEDVRSPTCEPLARTWIPKYHGKSGKENVKDETRSGRHDVDDDDRKEVNLFRGLSRIMLSLARVPQPRIGSFSFQDDGTVALTNRPLLASIMIAENAGTPRVNPAQSTYACVEPFVSDMLTFHQQRLLTDANLAYRRDRCRGEMATGVLLRALSHHYLDPKYRNGPFFLQLDDCHASNIFVDKDWNITCLIDLEWISSLPATTLYVPYWLTGQGIDQIRDEQLTTFEAAQDKFWAIFEEEESKLENSFPLTQMMRQSYASGASWFWHSVRSVNAMSFLFTDHLCPDFFRELQVNENALISKFWALGADQIVDDKLDQFDKHMLAVDQLFRRHGTPIDKTRS